MLASNSRVRQSIGYVVPMWKNEYLTPVPTKNL